MVNIGLALKENVKGGTVIVNMENIQMERVFKGSKP